MAMFGSENPALMTGNAQFGGSMDPMLLEAMMKNMPELKARQRRAEQLRGLEDKFGAMGQEGPQNYTRQQMGGLGPTVQRYHTDYGQIGKALTGALGGYMAGQGAETAQGSADQMLGEQVLGTAQAFGGGNTGGRMGTPNTGLGAGLPSTPTQPLSTSSVIPGSPGMTPGSGGGGVSPNGQIGQNVGMSQRSNAALANLSRWFGQ